MDKFKELLTSRKFLAAIVSIIVVALNKLLGWQIDEATLLMIVTTIVGWIIGQAIVDAKAPSPPA